MIVDKVRSPEQSVVLVVLVVMQRVRAPLGGAQQPGSVEIEVEEHVPRVVFLIAIAPHGTVTLLRWSSKIA